MRGYVVIIPGAHRHEWLCKGFTEKYPSQPSKLWPESLALGGPRDALSTIQLESVGNLRGGLGESWLALVSLGSNYVHCTYLTRLGYARRVLRHGHYTGS
jgi:hypothetical protein